MILKIKILLNKKDNILVPWYKYGYNNIDKFYSKLNKLKNHLFKPFLFDKNNTVAIQTNYDKI